MTEFTRWLIFSLSFIWFTNTSLSQETDYRSIFGSDWKKAEEFVFENEPWMRSACEKFDINYSFAAAIVFPELVRYSALLDKIEISLLKTLYINLGEDYADFSIGPFQMKPSFAEQIHENSNFLKERKIRSLFRTKSSFNDIKQYRRSIVADLEYVRRELNYLIAFIKICDVRYQIVWENETEKLQFYSTAYNCGLNKDYDYIEAMMDKKFFTTKLFKSETYSYSDISVFWNRLRKSNKAD